MVSLTKLVCTDFSAPDSLSLVIGCLLPFWYREDTFYMGILPPTLKKKEGQSVSFVCLFVFLYMLFLKCL